MNYRASASSKKHKDEEEEKKLHVVLEDMEGESLEFDFFRFAKAQIEEAKRSVREHLPASWEGERDEKTNAPIYVMLYHLDTYTLHL